MNPTARFRRKPCPGRFLFGSGCGMIKGAEREFCARGETNEIYRVERAGRDTQSGGAHGLYRADRGAGKGHPAHAGWPRCHCKSTHRHRQDVCLWHSAYFGRTAGEALSAGRGDGPHARACPANYGRPARFGPLLPGYPHCVRLWRCQHGKTGGTVEKGPADCGGDARPPARPYEPAEY